VTQAADLLKQAAALNQRAAQMIEEGHLDEAVATQKEADLLARRAKRRMSSRTGPPLSRPATQTGREIAVSALAELGVPANPRLVTTYASARFGATLRPTTFSSLRRDELRTWRSPHSDRVVYIAPALDLRRFTPLRGVVTLSDWDLWRRLVGPRSMRVDHLRATIAVARHLSWMKASFADEQAVAHMRFLLDDLARTLPGVPAGDRGVEADAVVELAQAELTHLEDDDRAVREVAARRAVEQLGERTVLWGIEPLHVVRQAKEA
jgi:hypothetical protein